MRQLIEKIPVLKNRSGKVSVVPRYGVGLSKCCWQNSAQAWTTSYVLGKWLCCRVSRQLQYITRGNCQHKTLILPESICFGFVLYITALRYGKAILIPLERGGVRI